MKFQEGPAFSAAIIGIGLGVMIWKSTGQFLLAVLAGLVIAGADYFFLIWVIALTKKK